MKMAFALFRYFPFGGLQKDMLRIARHCVEMGHEVTIVVGEWEGEQPEEIPVVLLSLSGSSNHARASAFATRLQQWLGDNPQQRVVGFNRLPGLDFYYGADSCFAAKTAEKHSSVVKLLPRYRTFLAFEKAVFGRGEATQLLMISAPEMAVYQQWYQTEPERVHLLPPGISRDRIAPPDAKEKGAAFRRQLGFGDNDLLVLMVGSGFRTKGLDRVIATIANLPEEFRERTRLLVVGADDPSPYQGEIKSRGLEQRVIFYGGRNDVPQFLLAADLMLHPAYHENTGTVLLEAMVAGLPVIATDACGYAGYISEGEMGVVLDSPYSQQSMDVAILSIFDADRNQWRSRGKQFADSADIYRLHQQAAELIVKGVDVD